ncbi:MAG: FAD-dependent oxidoreductase [Rhodoferax sp.]|uniref:NAD(P)/FAD-dependent oxidoreductase n=1 Tax=Rhodoferax sp. TaxID=50421 RepID=UPI00301A1D67
MKIAIIGSGISGLAAAHALHGKADLTLFEAGDYFGGHTHTVDLTLPGPNGLVTHGVDTGFLVFNERTYPQLIKLFAELGVAAVLSDMSFSVQVPDGRGHGPLEWSGSSLNTVFAQRSNLVNPRFLRLLRDVLRFNALATDLAKRGAEAALMQPLSDFLQQHKLSAEFRDWYLLPMLGCIWSCPTDQMLRFPVATMIRFCHNHGLLQVTNRPQWWTVAGGARHYVEKIVAQVADKRLNSPVDRITREAHGVSVTSRGQTERFDKVVLACHADQSLRLLGNPSPGEVEALSAIRYQPNRAVLHTDTSVLPRQRRAWAAWNYERAARPSSTTSAQQTPSDARVCLHYLLNLLQPLPFEQSVVLSLNPVHAIDPSQVHGTFEYDHPVFDAAAIRAQGQIPALQGQQHTYFCGAWTGYGFHEDGLKSGFDVAARLLQLV